MQYLTTDTSHYLIFHDNKENIFAKPTTNNRLNLRQWLPLCLTKPRTRNHTDPLITNWNSTPTVAPLSPVISSTKTVFMNLTYQHRRPYIVDGEALSPESHTCVSLLWWKRTRLSRFRYGPCLHLQREMDGVTLLTPRITSFEQVLGVFFTYTDTEFGSCWKESSCWNICIVALSCAKQLQLNADGSMLISITRYQSYSNDYT